MNIQSNRTSLLILGVVSLALSRTILFLVKDPEGPNLLVVVGLATVLFVLTLGVSSFTRVKKLVPVILIEVVIAAVFHCLFLI